MKHRPRPGQPMHSATTPRAEMSIKLLGGESKESVAVTHDEMNALRRLYGFTKERPHERPPEPKPPTENSYKAEQDYKHAMDQWRRWTDPSPFMQAGADRNMLRFANEDGLRLIAWLARYCEAGQDPMKVLIQLAIDGGLDVDPDDVEWATEEGEAATG